MWILSKFCLNYSSFSVLLLKFVYNHPCPNYLPVFLLTNLGQMHIIISKHPLTFLLSSPHSPLSLHPPQFTRELLALLLLVFISQHLLTSEPSRGSLVQWLKVETLLLEFLGSNRLSVTLGKLLKTSVAYCPICKVWYKYLLHTVFTNSK